MGWSKQCNWCSKMRHAGISGGFENPHNAFSSGKVEDIISLGSNAITQRDMFIDRCCITNNESVEKKNLTEIQHVAAMEAFKSKYVGFKPMRKASCSCGSRSRSSDMIYDKRPWVQRTEVAAAISRATIPACIKACTELEFIREAPNKHTITKNKQFVDL